MKLQCFPTSATEASAWAQRYGEPEELAVRRRIKFAALDCLARETSLSQTVILRGSVALSFYNPTNRLGSDIDLYSTSLPEFATEGDVAVLVNRLNSAMYAWLPTHFPDLSRWSTRIKSEIKFEVMRLRYDLKWCNLRLPSPSHRSLRVASLECLIAEKLLAMLRQGRDRQKGINSKSRSKDVLDVYHVLRHSASPVDLRKIVYNFEAQKVEENDTFALSRPLFNNDLMRSLGAEQYSGKAHAKAVEIPFDEAWASVVSLVDALGNLKQTDI